MRWNSFQIFSQEVYRPSLEPQISTPSPLTTTSSIAIEKSDHQVLAHKQHNHDPLINLFAFVVLLENLWPWHLPIAPTEISNPQG